MEYNDMHLSHLVLNILYNVLSFKYMLRFLRKERKLEFTTVTVFYIAPAI